MNRYLYDWVSLVQCWELFDYTKAVCSDRWWKLRAAQWQQEILTWSCSIVLLDISFPRVDVWLTCWDWNRNLTVCGRKEQDQLSVIVMHWYDNPCDDMRAGREGQHCCGTTVDSLHGPDTHPWPGLTLPLGKKQTILWCASNSKIYEDRQDSFVIHCVEGYRKVKDSEDQQQFG